MKLREKLRNNKIYATVARVIVSLLLVALIAPSVSGLKVKAADTAPGETKDILNTIQGTKVSNAYILETSTGSVAGDIIDFAIIRYKCKSGTKKQYLFPTNDTLKLGYAQVAQVGTEDSISNVISEKMGYEANKGWKNAEGLRAYKTDQFYFTLDEPITSVESIDFFAGAAGTWTCLAVRLFEVNELYGLKMAGVWSSEYYVDFKGKLIYAMEDNASNSWSPTGCQMLHMDEYRTWLTDFSTKDFGTHVTQESRTYGFRMDFSDSYKAGFESLFASYDDGKKKILDLNICEDMVYNIEYLDIYGIPRTIHLPVTTATAYWLDKRGITSPVCGIGLQGEDLSFTGEIPDCKSIRDITISMGPTLAQRDGSIKHSGKFATRGGQRENQALGEKINIDSFAVYDMNTASFSPRVEGAVIKYDYAGTPILVYTSPNKAGREMNAGAAEKVGLRMYENQNLDPAEPKQVEGYVFQIKTDNVSIASTKGDLKVTISYVSTGGVSVTTKEMDLKDLVREYYGYWPGKIEGNTFGPGLNGDDFAYYYGLTKGQTLTFYLQLDGVDHFTAATVSLDEKGDEYQFASFSAYSVTTLGYRSITWEDLSSEGVKSRLKYTRSITVNGEKRDLLDEKAGVAVHLRTIEGSILVLPGQTKSIDFITNEIKTLEEKGFDIGKYSISYEEAMKNFGFTKSRVTYKVKIHVDQDGKSAATVNDSPNADSDAGSENLFYVQLGFSSGADSAFVLANQQLEGDRFRSGATHEITIITNQDYGEVTQVRIIPDDISSDNHKYDKLNIDKITITQGNIYIGSEGMASGTHRQWECRNVGWIGIDYTDEAAGKGPVAKEGRNLTEIARTFYVDYITNVVELEFSLITNRGDKSESRNTDGKMVRNYVDQFRGSITGRIVYTDNAGATQYYDFDLVKAMYEYMGKAVSGNKVVSDPNYMFRESHTDRFFVSIADVKLIQAVDMDVSALDYDYKWNIGGISARIVKEKGNLRLNAFDEFEYEYPTEENPEEAIILKASSTANPVADPVLTQSMQTVHIPVDCSEIKIEDQAGFPVVSYTRMPLTGDDVLNIYVFPSQGTLANDISEYDLNCNVQYVHPAGMYYAEDVMRKRARDDEAGTRAMFYLIGLKAKNMLDVNRVTLKAMSEYANMCVLDYAVIQQVRSGTIVATYYLDLDKREASMEGVIAFPSEKSSLLGYTEEQVVTAQFGSGTVAKGLYAERSDVGFAIEYTSIFDPYGPQYRSPIHYLTDEDINRIKDGQVVDLHFNQVFVGRITGLYAVATGDIQATVDKAVVANYRKDVGDYKVLDGWYSFGQGIALDNSLTAMYPTAEEITSPDSIMPVEFTIKTADAAQSYESGTRDPVRAIIYKTDWADNVMSEEVPDLRRFIVGTDSNFLTGKTQTVRMLLVGAAGIRRVSLEPVKGDLTGGWSIDTISCKVGDNDPIERNVGQRIYEGEPREVIFTNVTVNTIVQYYNVGKGAFDQQRVTNNTLSVISPNKQVIYVTPSVVGSEYGFSIKACEITTDGYEGADMTHKLTGPTIGRYVFDPGENTTGKQKYYRITVTSEETKEAKVIINITVESADETAIAQKAAQDAAELILNRQEFSSYQSSQMSAVRNMEVAGDSDDTRALIDTAYAKIKDLSYDAGKNLADNKSRVDSIVSDLQKAIEKQRKTEADQAALLAEFNNAKNAALSTVANAGEAGDSEACNTIIENARGDINMWDYHPEMTMEENTEKFDNILAQLESDLYDQRVEDFAAAKTAALAAADAKGKAGDSEACSNLIIAAKNDIDSRVYNNAMTPAANKGELDAILSNLDTALANQRAADQPEQGGGDGGAGGGGGTG